MSSTKISNERTKQSASASKADLKLELVVIPVCSIHFGKGVATGVAEQE